MIEEEILSQTQPVSSSKTALLSSLDRLAVTFNRVLFFKNNYMMFYETDWEEILSNAMKMFVEPFAKIESGLKTQIMNLCAKIQSLQQLPSFDSDPIYLGDFIEKCLLEIQTSNTFKIISYREIASMASSESFNLQVVVEQQALLDKMANPSKKFPSQCNCEICYIYVSTCVLNRKSCLIEL